MILIATLGILLAGFPLLLKNIQRERRRRLLALQLRQSLQTMVHCLQVGTSFLQALERVSQEGDEPLAQEWKRLLQSIQMGTSQRQALADLGQRVPLKEMAWFITAAQITQETGGSLSGVLGTLSSTLQERETLREKVSALTAQGKASGMLLGALPFLMMTALSIVAPDFMSPLFHTPQGQTLLAVVLVLVVTGGLVIRKIVSIKAD